jgi:hypothetical protein
VDDLQQRVTFRFGAAADVRYLSDVPEVGDFVSHRGDLWVVTRVEVDPVGVLVICEDRGSTGSRPSGGPVRSSDAGIPSGIT